MNEFLDNLMPLYNSLILPFINLYGWWSILFFGIILGLTTIINNALSKWLGDNQLRKSMTILSRYLLCVVIMWIMGYIVSGIWLSVIPNLTTSLIATIVAGMLYALIKFIGIKNLIKIVLSKLLVVLKNSSLPNQLSKLTGIDKYLINKIIDFIGNKIENIQISDTSISNYNAYIQSEKEITDTIKTILNGIIDTDKIDTATNTINSVLKTILNSSSTTTINTNIDKTATK